MHIGRPDEDASQPTVSVDDGATAHSGDGVSLDSQLNLGVV